MTPTASVSIDRTSLNLSALVIAGTRPATYFLTDVGLGRPQITRRNTYMPDSPYIHGSELITSVKEQSTLPMVVQVQATTSAALDSALVALYDALDQFAFNTTVTVNGVTKTWACDPANYGSVDGTVSAIREAAFFEVLSITIPVYPIPS